MRSSTPREPVPSRVPIGCASVRLLGRALLRGERAFLIDVFEVPNGGATVHVRTFDGTGAGCGDADTLVDTSVDVYDASGALPLGSDARLTPRRT